VLRRAYGRTFAASNARKANADYAALFDGWRSARGRGRSRVKWAGGAQKHAPPLWALKPCRPAMPAH